MPIVFTDDEIFSFLTLIEETNVQKKIDGKTQRNSDVFKDLASQLGGDKSYEQWRTKWKALKAKYLSEKRESTKSGWLET